jgi:hypothetical protein
MKKMNSGWRYKAQASIEFMFIFILFVSVLVVVMVSVIQNNEAIFILRQNLEAEQTLSFAKGKLDTAFLEGDGFSSNFTLPQQIMGFNYIIGISSNFLFLEMNNQTYSKILLSRNVTGTLRKGENRIININNLLVVS